MASESLLAAQTTVDARMAQATALLSRLPAAVAGQRGQDKTWDAILACRGKGLSADEAMTALVAWNYRCSPPWTDLELRTKVVRGYASSRLPLGARLRATVGSADQLCAQITEGMRSTWTRVWSCTPPHPLVPPAIPHERTVWGYLGILADEWVIPTVISNRDLRWNNPIEPWNAPTSPRLAATVGGPPAANDRQARSIQLHVKDLPEATYQGLLARVLYRRSSYGTSKNRSLKSMVRELVEASRDGKRAIAIVHRRALARSVGRAWGMPVYLDCPDEEITGSCVICIDSIGRLASGPIDLLVTDESEQVIQHLFRGPLRRQRKTGEIWSAWRDVAGRSRRIIFQDARLSGLTSTCARKLLGWKVSSESDEQIIVNTWAPKPPDAHIWADEDAWLESLFTALTDPDPTRSEWVATLSKEHAKKLEEMVRGRFPLMSILTVHADTSKSSEVRACFEEPSMFSNYRLVIASPSCGTGVSVEAVGRWHVWLHARSGCGPNALDALQMLHRPRAPLGAWQIWVGGHAVAGPTDPAECLRINTEKSAESIARMKTLTTYGVEYKDGNTPTLLPDNPDLVELDALVEALNNEWGGCLGDTETKDEDGNVIGTREGSLIRALRELGCYMILIHAACSDPKAAKEEAAKAKLAVEEREIETLETAEEKSLEAAELAAAAEDAPPEADAALKWAKHADFFGLTPGAPRDRELIRRDLRGDYRGQCCEFVRLHWKRTGKWTMVILQDRHDVSTGHTIDLRHRASATETRDEALALFGLTDLDLTARTQAVIQGPGAAAFSKDLIARMKKHLGITWNPAKSTPMRLLSSLLKGIGLAYENRPVRVPGSRQLASEYRLRADLLAQVEKDSDHYRQRNERPLQQASNFPVGEFDLGALAAILAPEEYRVAA